MEWEHGLTAGLTALLLGAFARHALREPEVVGGTVTLRYLRALRIVLWVGLVLFAALSVGVLWPFLAGNTTEKDARTLALGLPVGLVLGAGCAAELRVALELDLEGIRGRTAFRGRRAIAWADVTAVKWSPSNHWFVVVDRRGEKIRVSRFLRGHTALLSLLREKVAPAIWEKAVAAYEKTPSPF